MANPVLQYGAQGPEVAWLATQLGYMGYSPSMTDVYDWQTAEAVAELQRRYGYYPDGRMGPETWALLEAVMTAAPIPPPPPGIQDIQGVVPQPGPLSTGPYNRDPFAGGTDTPGQRDALTRLKNTLKVFGLESDALTEWVTGKLKSGATADEIGLELLERPEFKTRFPAVHLRRTAGLPPIDAAGVLQYENSARELMRRAGIADGVYTTSEYLQTKLIANDVSVAELGDRLTDGYLKVVNAPPEVRAAMATYFGAEGDAALMKLFLDPEQAVPELEKKAMTAYAGGVGARFGMTLAQTVARDIADTGATDAQVWAGFKSLEALAPVFHESISETVDLTAGKEGVESAFGLRAGGKTAIENRVGARKAVFKGGGGAGATQEGVRGLGVADT